LEESLGDKRLTERTGKKVTTLIFETDLAARVA